jgi:DNA-binding response OmpR family regulator
MSWLQGADMVAHSSGFRVAVLDDDQDVVVSIAAVLRRQGIRAEEFTSAAELGVAVRDRGFDAYVLDWLLGDATALDLIAILRASKIARDAPIILLSGNLAVGGVPSDEALASAIDRYGLFYRAKPYSALKLARDLHVALDGGSP